MGVNKVVYGTTTLIDISDSTIAENNILKGYKGYGANGDEVVGEIETVKAAMPTITTTAWDEDGEICIDVANNQPKGYVRGGFPAYNQIYATLTVSGDTATMQCGDAKITRKVGASVATCTVQVKFTTTPETTLISATTFVNGAISVYNSSANSGTITIPNVVCGSALSINTQSMVSLYTSASQQPHNGLLGGTIKVPATAGTYTVEVGMLDD